MLKKMFVVAALALTLAGCGAAEKVTDFVAAVTQTVVNPVTSSDIYAAKNTYLVTVKLANAYRRSCYAAPYATLMSDPVKGPLCKYRRSVIRVAQQADAKAFSAITSAEKFIRDNPTIDATSAVKAAWDAVKSFQNAVPGA